MQTSQISALDRTSASLPVYRIGFTPFSDVRLRGARSPDLQPTTALSPALIQPSFTDRTAAQIPWQEAQAYRQPEASVRFAVPQAIAQNVAATTPSSGQARELALLSADVYRDIVTPPAGYRVAVDADLSTLGLKPADLTSTQSPFRARVYIKGSGAETEYVIAFRGTTSGGDWSSNLRQSVGLSSDHYRRALYIGSKLALASDANVSITGHSLGGGLASAAAIASGRNAATFNSAGVSDATIDAARAIHASTGVTTDDNVSAYYVRGDILSAIQDGGDRFLGGFIGGIGGALLADAPEAYGKRIALEAVRPEGLRWYQDNAVARHGIDWVLASLNR